MKSGRRQHFSHFSLVQTTFFVRRRHFIQCRVVFTPVLGSGHYPECFAKMSARSRRSKKLVTPFGTENPHEIVPKNIPGNVPNKNIHCKD